MNNQNNTLANRVLTTSYVSKPTTCQMALLKDVKRHNILQKASLYTSNQLIYFHIKKRSKHDDTFKVIAFYKIDGAEQLKSNEHRFEKRIKNYH